jgi:hypothetical protein
MLFLLVSAGLQYIKTLLLNHVTYLLSPFNYQSIQANHVLSVLKFRIRTIILQYFDFVQLSGFFTNNHS